MRNPTFEVEKQLRILSLRQPYRWHNRCCNTWKPPQGSRDCPSTQAPLYYGGVRHAARQPQSAVLRGPADVFSKKGVSAKASHDKASRRRPGNGDAQGLADTYDFYGCTTGDNVETSFSLGFLPAHA